MYTILKNAKATEVLHDIPSCRKDNCHFLITERMQPGRTAVNIIGCVVTMAFVVSSAVLLPNSQTFL